MFTTLLMRHLKEARNLDILYVTSVYNTKGRMSLPSFSLKKKITFSYLWVWANMPRWVCRGQRLTDGVRLGRDLHSLSHLQPSRLNSINVTW